MNKNIIIAILLVCLVVLGFLFLKETKLISQEALTIKTPKVGEKDWRTLEEIAKADGGFAVKITEAENKLIRNAVFNSIPDRLKKDINNFPNARPYYCVGLGTHTVYYSNYNWGTYWEPDSVSCFAIQEL